MRYIPNFIFKGKKGGTGEIFNWGLARKAKAYDDKNNPYYAAARLWVDEIIDPAETRKYVSMGIEAANNNPDIQKFNTGVIQT